MWARSAEPWQREVRTWSRGAAEVSDRGAGGGCDCGPVIQQLWPWRSLEGVGGKGGFPVSPAKAKGLFVSRRG